MRLRMTEHRERMLEALLDATGEKTKSKAIDRAIGHYCRCAGENAAHPTGTYEALMELVVKEGSITPAEVAKELGSKELPIEYNHEWNING